MSIDALLLDLDGTLYVGDAPLPGAVQAVRTLAERNMACRYLTNTTRRSRRALAERLQHMGFPIHEEELFTAPLAAAGWLRERGLRRIALHVPEATWEDFAGFEAVDEGADAVVIGDLGEAWTFARLNAAFRQLLDGAVLVALQKNRYWETPTGLTLDAGPFVAALEYATAQEAVVVGKPSPAFFQLASAAVGVPSERTAVVGDDVEVDIAGAQAAGLRGVLVRTGKYRAEVLARSGVEPDWIVDSLPQLVADWFSPGLRRTAE